MIHIINKELKLEKWASIINAQKLSGKSRKAWCIENNVNFHNLVYWNKRLSSNSKPDIEPSLTSNEQFEWASVVVSKEVSEIILEIDSVKIHLKPNFDEQLLTKLIKTLKSI